MINEVKRLIAEGLTERAIGILLPFSESATLLQARYSSGKNQYNMGLIEFSEWKLIQAQINFTLLEIADGLTSQDQDLSEDEVAGIITRLSDRIKSVEAENILLRSANSNLKRENQLYKDSITRIKSIIKP